MDYSEIFVSEIQPNVAETLGNILKFGKEYFDQWMVNTSRNLSHMGWALNIGAAKLFSLRLLCRYNDLDCRWNIYIIKPCWDVLLLCSNCFPNKWNFNCIHNGQRFNYHSTLITNFSHYFSFSAKHWFERSEATALMHYRRAALIRKWPLWTTLFSVLLFLHLLFFSQKWFS